MIHVTKNELKRIENFIAPLLLILFQDKLV